MSSTKSITSSRIWIVVTYRIKGCLADYHREKQTQLSAAFGLCGNHVCEWTKWVAHDQLCHLLLDGMNRNDWKQLKVPIVILFALSGWSSRVEAAVIDIRVSFLGASLANVPSGSYNTFSLPNPGGQSVNNLVDFNTAAPTQIGYESLGWEDRFGTTQWPVADLADWIDIETTVGGWFVRDGTKASFAFNGVPQGGYRVEILSTTGSPHVQDVSVNGDFTSVTFRDTGASSDDYNPRRDGFDDRNWMIWEDVVPLNGRIDILFEKVEGQASVNALRLTSIPELSALGMVAIVGLLIAFRRKR
jgi:hypothetical protein